ncbi:MAG TPA: hypothetical protein PKD91_08065 [Bacteroidia bacterium]|nr:hypothetical protein [Bacteroidia bacterium]
MMKNKLVLSAIITAIFAISCQSNRKEIPEGSKLFNLTDYFSGQIKALEKSKTPLTKTILNKGKTETVRIENVDWKTELKPFTEIDLNKPAVYLSYKADSVVNGTKTIIHYAAKDSTPLLRDMMIHMDHHIPDSIIIRKVISNSYVSSDEILKYTGQGNFEIHVNNVPGIGKDIQFVLKAVSGAPSQP